MLALSLLLLAPGLALPAIAIERFWFGTDYSILGAVAALASDGDWFLAGVIGVFSVALPVAKLAIGFLVWRRGRASRRLARVLGAASRYAMLDVFIVALTVLALDGRLMTAASAGPGIVCFAVSMLLSAWAVSRLGQPGR